MRVGNLVLRPDFSHKNREVAFRGTDLTTPCGLDLNDASWLCGPKGLLESRPVLDHEQMFFGPSTT
jgi:hypothetical protein